MKIRYVFFVCVACLGGILSPIYCALLTCTGANNTGHCLITGTGLLQVANTLNAQTLTIAPEPNANLGIVLSLGQGNNNIDKLIINREAGKAADGSPLRLTITQAGATNTTLTIGAVTKNTGINSPLGVYLRESQFTLTHQDGTSGVSVTLANAQVINKPNHSSAISSNPTGGGNTGGSVTLPPNATPEQTINAVLKYAQALKEQLALESTNTMILYNMLNNYEGNYINYDYGLAHQVGIGAFNNGGFFRYYYQKGKNGFDIGTKLKIRLANRFYLKGAGYYTFFDNHSIVLGLGLYKELDFALGKSGNLFFVLNPSANLYYATTLKGKYMPANHLGFGNVGLEMGLRIKKTSLLARGSAGGAINSLKSISLDLGGGASYTNATFFNNALYATSFVLSQGIGNRFYITADIGAVFVDKILLDKSYLLKAGVLLGYEFGKNNHKHTKQSARYQKLKSKNARKSSTANPPTNTRLNTQNSINSQNPTTNASPTQSTKNNPRSTALNPANASTNTTNTTANLNAKQPKKQIPPKSTKSNAKTTKPTKSSKSPKSSKSTAKPPKVNLPKVSKSTSTKEASKSSTKANAARTTNAKSSAPKRNKN